MSCKVRCYHFLGSMQLFVEWQMSMNYIMADELYYAGAKGFLAQLMKVQ